MKFLSAGLTAVLSWAFLLSANASVDPATSSENSPVGKIPALLLISPRESTALDAQIRVSQRRLASSTAPGAELERLGWLYVAKARTTSDPGFFTLAGIAADALEKSFGSPQEAWLIRGHVLQTRHRFADAEILARKLVEGRGAAADFALLGDALYDQGKVMEAAGAYQQMVDLKPSLDSYSRAANIRWIKGDVEAAVQLQALAVRSGGPGDPGSLAWALCRLGQFLWQQGNTGEAHLCAKRSLELVMNYGPALLLEGRLLLSENRAADALVPLSQAIEILPLPEPRWVYAEALRAAGHEDQALEIEARLVRDGTAEDPRTVSLFLATRNHGNSAAIQLSQAELKVRADIVTHAANALTLARGGRTDEATIEGKAALAEGTVDVRILLYAGYAAALAHQPEAVDLLSRAEKLSGLLLPSERRLLQESLSLLPKDAGPKDNLLQPTQNKKS